MEQGSGSSRSALDNLAGSFTLHKIDIVLMFCYNW
jgi:hypothetical protein